MIDCDIHKIDPWRKSVTQQAIDAANSVVYKGEMVDPPSGVSVGRWRAMINQIIWNGPPLHR